MKKLSVILVLCCLGFMASPVQAQPFGPPQDVDGAQTNSRKMLPITPPSKDVQEARRNLQVVMLKERLKLSDAQVNKLSGILKSLDEKTLKDFEETKTDEKERQARFLLRRMEQQVAIFTMLNDDQKKEFAIMKSERKMRKMDKRGGPKDFAPRMGGKY